MSDEKQTPAGFPDFEAEGRSSSPGGEGAADLVREFYAPIYRLAFAVLESDEAARQAAVRTLAAAQRDRATLASGGPLWLFTIALKEIQRLGRPPRESAPTEDGLRRLVDGWDTRERQLAVFHYLLGRPLAESAAALKVSAGAVQAQLDIFQQQFAALPPSGGAPIPDVPATERIQEPGYPAITPAERRGAAYLEQRWPAPELSEDEIEDLSDEVARLAAGLAAPRLGTGTGRRTALISAAALVICTLAGLSIWLLGANGIGPLARATATDAIAGFPTQYPPTPRVERLTRRSTSDEIRFRWEESTRLWPSVTVDAQIVDYGPPSYIGPARSYRAQGWVLQPDQGIELFSLLSQPVGQVYLVGAGRAFTRSYVMDRTWSQTWSGEPADLLANAGLQGMVFPATSSWARRDGSFWWAGAEDSRPAGRPVVVFDWLNHLNQREARLWLDIETGMILREQVFSGPEFERLQRESLVTEIAFSRREPPPSLIVAARQSQSLAAVTPGFQAIASTPTPALAATQSAPIPTDPAPPGMDPSQSRLIFQFAADPSLANLQTDTASVPAALFADGYYLGQVRFGLPWVLRCHRSADGRRVAFNTGSDGASAPDDNLRWFNLSEPERIYQPLPGFHADEFAFNPDGRTLAAAGAGGDGDGAEASGLNTGIYLVEIATGEFTQLLEVAETRSLLWSPDGEFLALIGRLPGEDLPAMLVVHVRTGQIAFQGEPGQVSGPPPLDSPLTEWGVTFPVEMGGMEDCAARRH